MQTEELLNGMQKMLMPEKRRPVVVVVVVLLIAWMLTHDLRLRLMQPVQVVGIALLQIRVPPKHLVFLVKLPVRRTTSADAVLTARGVLLEL